METDPFNATLIQRQDLTVDLSIVRVRPDSGQVPSFEPGQFVNLGLPPDESEPQPDPTVRPRRRPRLIRRAYSIASSPLQRDYLEFYITLVEQGRFTRKLWTVEQNGRLFMEERCAGYFTLQQVPPGRDLVMIATGTGVAPFISMLRTYHGQERWRRLVIVHSARLAAELGYRDFLERLSAQDDSVIYLPTVTREPLDSAWTGLRGRPQMLLEDGRYERLAGNALDPATCEVFLCGNPAMIESMKQMLEAGGFHAGDHRHPGNIHFERYW